MKIIGITTGDPAGVGPEVTSKSLRFHKLQGDIAYVVYGRFNYSHSGNQPIRINSIEEVTEPQQIYVIEVDGDIEIGKPSSESGKIAYQTLDRCAQDIKDKRVSALVTAPLSKTHIIDAGYDFIGHTEFLQQKLASDNVAMTFWSDELNVALLTTHLPLHELVTTLSKEYVTDKIKLICSEVAKIIDKPRFALLGKNPHAGENGAFGQTDIMFENIIAELNDSGYDISGPFPADTFFSYNKEKYDFVISSYHDQALIPFKMLADGKGVNVTLGLPIYRSSADHGTAFDIAGKDIADYQSMKSALVWAESRLTTNLKKEVNYSEFGNFYDNYMAHVSYDKWVALLKVWTESFTRKAPKRIFELACGTGEIMKRFVKDGVEVFGGDISEGMLHIAQTKAQSAKLFRHDMRNALPVNSLDLVICVFDSLNYLLKEEYVLSMMKNVKESLSDDGLFIFDISTIFNCEEILDGFINYEEYNNYTVLHTSEWLPEKEMQESALDIYKKGKYFSTNYKENHLQRIYPVRTIRSFIEKAGLELVGVYNNTDNLNLLNYYPEDLDTKFSRIYFIVKK